MQVDLVDHHDASEINQLLVPRAPIAGVEEQIGHPADERPITVGEIPELDLHSAVLKQRVALTLPLPGVRTTARLQQPVQEMLNLLGVIHALPSETRQPCSQRDQRERFLEEALESLGAEERRLGPGCQVKAF